MEGGVVLPFGLAVPSALIDWYVNFFLITRRANARFLCRFRSLFADAGRCEDGIQLFCATQLLRLYLCPKGPFRAGLRGIAWLILFVYSWRNYVASLQLLSRAFNKSKF